MHSDLLLVAAAVLATLAVQRHLTPPRSPASRIADGDRGCEADRRFAAGYSIARLDGILWRTYNRIINGRLPAIAAGTVFYGLLALFPAITALVSSYGLFADRSTIAANLQSLAVMLPEGSFSVIQDQVARVLAKGSTSLGFTVAGSPLVALWSATPG